ncbi:DUF885 domain-containing protein [Tsuneonella suprasediminis]|uniref:DUF885 domain-containing protein n=1 Tax=Tsuneonella suprasediminis TaxID=2306996 RepID=A0A419R3K6_9SPHN|nr:DUF885 domain-containing protein [Tsuneonella suprasediminis]RJX69104.1 DUF885 domain-containing protein [Tsuneonella suprasediminis]
MKALKAIHFGHLCGVALAICLVSTPALGRTTAEPSLDSIAHEYTHVQDRSEPGIAPDWPDISPVAQEEKQRRLQTLLTQLDNLPPTDDVNRQFDRAMLRYMLESDLAAFPFDQSRMPFSNGQGFFRIPGNVANTTTIRNRADADNWLARLASAPDFYTAHIANMRRGLKDGFTQPGLIVDEMLRPLQAAVDTPVADDALLKPFASLPPSIAPTDQARLRTEAVRLIAEKVRPAQRAAVKFMREEYRPAARSTLAARDLPGGEEFYPYLIRKFTTTDLTPEQIHAIGESEVARIRGEMEAIARSTGFTGTIAEFNDALRADPANFAASPEDYMEKASEVSKRADRAIPRWFGKLPRLTWGPLFKTPAQEGTANIYLRGSLEKGVPGSIMMSHRDATKSPLYQLPAWVIHEGVPGHHFQISRTQENEDLPEFRREARVTALIEGWALYAEGLAEEMGLYHTEKERFGRLSFEMYRACRLVMDTGIHWMRWSRERARECLAQNTALSPAMVEFETNRYISQPGQALAYKIGELRIREIRTRAERALGPKFDIRAFHDALIDGGPMPLAMLDRYMDDWIAAQAK